MSLSLNVANDVYSNQAIQCTNQENEGATVEYQHIFSWSMIHMVQYRILLKQ